VGTGEGMGIGINCYMGMGGNEKDTNPFSETAIFEWVSVKLSSAFMTTALRKAGNRALAG